LNYRPPLAPGKVERGPLGDYTNMTSIAITLPLRSEGAQPTLCDAPVLCPVGTPRPKESDPEVLDETVKAILPRVIQWLGTDYRPEEDAEIADQLRGAIEYCWGGYDIARRLDEHYHWTCDAELVEILEDVSSARRDAQRKFEARWVKATGITPKFSVGDAVRGKTRGEEYSGFVARVDLLQGTYLVRVPSLGHITAEEARNSRTGGTLGVVLPWEEVHAQ
jgi:hypothetical protein